MDVLVVSTGSGRLGAARHVAKVVVSGRWKGGRMALCIALSIDQVVYAIPLLPLITRGVLGALNATRMRDPLLDEERDEDSHRTHILAFAGFAFAGILAVALVDVSSTREFDK